MGPGDPYAQTNDAPRYEPRTESPGDASRESISARPPVPPRGMTGKRLLMGFLSGAVFGGLVLALGLGPAMKLFLWGCLGALVVGTVTFLGQRDFSSVLEAGLRKLREKSHIQE